MAIRRNVVEDKLLGMKLAEVLRDLANRIERRETEGEVFTITGNGVTVDFSHKEYEEGVWDVVLRSTEFPDT